MMWGGRGVVKECSLVLSMCLELVFRSAVSEPLIKRLTWVVDSLLHLEPLKLNFHKFPGDECNFDLIIYHKFHAMT